MTADFNWYLNRQGPRGQQGIRGEQGFSPVITVFENSAKAYILRIQTQDGTFLTPNLRGTVEDLGGTYVRYNPETGQVYAGSPDIATTETYGMVKIATAQDVTDASQDVVVTPELLVNQINALDLPNNYVTTNTNQVINASKNFTRNVEFTNTSNVTFRNEIKAPSIIEPYHGSTVISYKQDSSGNNRYIQVGGSQGKVVVRPALKVVVDSVEYDVISAKDLATTDKAGIVKPDGSTVFIDENGVISAKSVKIDDINPSSETVYSSNKVEELLMDYVPLSTYNELLARVEALENEINGGNA